MRQYCERAAGEAHNQAVAEALMQKELVGSRAESEGSGWGGGQTG